MTVDLGLVAVFSGVAMILAQLAEIRMGTERKDESEPQPEYVKCVDSINGVTWCGRKPAVFEFRFIDAQHAALARLQRQRLLVCPACRRAIVDALENEK